MEPYGKEKARRWHHVMNVIARINFPGYQFYPQCLANDEPGLVTVHVQYEEKDVMSGVKETQHGRRWIIEDDATDMAIIQTCFKALMTSLEHRARENFTVDNKAIMQPHYTLDDILEIAPERTVEAEAIEV